MKKILFAIFMFVVSNFVVMDVKAEKSPEDSDITYNQAIDYINDKKYPQAIGLLTDMKDNKNAEDLIEQLRYLINGSYISNGIWAVGAITTKGGVQVAYNGEGSNPYSAVKAWKNMKAISFRGGDSIESLTAKGRIVTTSTDTVRELLKSPVVSESAMANVVKAVSGWRNIKAFQTFYPQSAVALDKKGFVYAAYAFYEDGTVKLKGWDNIVAIADGRSYLAGLKEDGTVICKDYDYSGTLDTSEWKDIVAISAGASLVGLKEDGTVVSTGLKRNGGGDVSDWKDIIAVSTDHSYTLGLKSDGTVIAAGTSPYGATEVSEWSDIVAIQAGYYFSIGLKADGTIVLSGDSSTSGAATPDISKMKNLYVPKISIKGGTKN